jgi:hypothetical protein
MKRDCFPLQGSEVHLRSGRFSFVVAYFANCP